MGTGRRGVAGRPGLAGARDLAEVWRGVRRDDVFPARPLVGLLGFFGRKDHLVPAGPLRALLGRHLGYARLEDAPIPVRVVTSEVTTGVEVVLHRGNAIDAVAASAAIPGVFPPVTIDGHQLMDGGVANNTPISHAIDEGATIVYVLPTGFACALDRAPNSALGMALQAITLLVQQRLAVDVARYQGTVDCASYPPCARLLSPPSTSPTPAS